MLPPATREAAPAGGAGPLAPLRALGLRTAPPLLVCLAAGASGFASIAEAFRVRERLGLSAASIAGRCGATAPFQDAIRSLTCAMSASAQAERRP